FTIENMLMWNVLPPCLASAGAIIYLASVNLAMAATLPAGAGAVVIALFRYASRGKPLHHDFAKKAAVVDGEMVDVVGNMSLVRALCGLTREHVRLDQTVSRQL